MHRVSLPTPGASRTSPPNNAFDPFLRSMLVLTGAEQHAASVDAGLSDGLLTAMEASSLDLRGTDLVLLVACMTGQGHALPGEGVAGLRSVFVVAGARSIMASLWEVPAAETIAQISMFYSNWLRPGQTPQRYAAFRDSQRAALRAAREATGTGHPFYWAGFTYSGDPGDLPKVH